MANEIYYCKECGKAGKFIGRGIPKEPICVRCFEASQPKNLGEYIEKVCF